MGAKFEEKAFAHNSAHNQNMEMKGGETG